MVVLCFFLSKVSLEFRKFFFVLEFNNRCISLFLLSGNASHLEIVSMDGSSGPTKSINMNGGETLVVTFQGATPFDVNFGYEEVDSGEIMTSMAPFSPTQYIVSMNGTNGGVSAVNFQVVPEPSAILLGGLGSLLLFRRRRA